MEQVSGSPFFISLQPRPENGIHGMTMQFRRKAYA
jgi:hypothetical protein